MASVLLVLIALIAAQPQLTPVRAGDHACQLTVGELNAATMFMCPRVTIRESRRRLCSSCTVH